MSGTLLLTTERNGKSVTVPAVMLVQYPDKLRLEIQDPVGSTLALLIIQGERFWLYQKDRRENLTGPLSAIPSEVRFPFNAEDLTRVFLARPYWSAFEGMAVGEGFKVSRATKTGRETLAYDSRELTPVSWRSESKGFSAATAAFEEFEARDGARYPTRIRLSANAGGKSVLVVWKDWQPSVAKTKNHFEIPPSQDFGRPTKALR
jgi:outer membrane lipoprotein-sorting protein